MGTAKWKPSQVASHACLTRADQGGQSGSEPGSGTTSSQGGRVEIRRTYMEVCTPVYVYMNCTHHSNVGSPSKYSHHAPVSTCKYLPWTNVLRTPYSAAPTVRYSYGVACRRLCASIVSTPPRIPASADDLNVAGVESVGWRRWGGDDGEANVLAGRPWLVRSGRRSYCTCQRCTECCAALVGAAHVGAEYEDDADGRHEQEWYLPAARSGVRLQYVTAGASDAHAHRDAAQPSGRWLVRLRRRRAPGRQHPSPSPPTKVPGQSVAWCRPRRFPPAHWRERRRRGDGSGAHGDDAAFSKRPLIPPLPRCSLATGRMTAPGHACTSMHGLEAAHSRAPYGVVACTSMRLQPHARVRLVIGRRLGPPQHPQLPPLIHPPASVRPPDRPGRLRTAVGVFGLVTPACARPMQGTCRRWRRAMPCSPGAAARSSSQAVAAVDTLAQDSTRSHHASCRRREGGRNEYEGERLLPASSALCLRDTAVTMGARRKVARSAVTFGVGGCWPILTVVSDDGRTTTVRGRRARCRVRKTRDGEGWPPVTSRHDQPISAQARHAASHAATYEAGDGGWTPSSIIIAVCAVQYLYRVSIRATPRIRRSHWYRVRSIAVMCLYCRNVLAFRACPEMDVLVGGIAAGCLLCHSRTSVPSTRYPARAEKMADERFSAPGRGAVAADGGEEDTATTRPCSVPYASSVVIPFHPRPRGGRVKLPAERYRSRPARPALSLDDTRRVRRRGETTDQLAAGTLRGAAVDQQPSPLGRNGRRVGAAKTVHRNGRCQLDGRLAAPLAPPTEALLRFVRAALTRDSSVPEQAGTGGCGRTSAASASAQEHTCSTWVHVELRTSTALQAHVLTGACTAPLPTVHAQRTKGRSLEMHPPLLMGPGEGKESRETRRRWFESTRMRASKVQALATSGPRAGTRPRLPAAMQRSTPCATGKWLQVRAEMCTRTNLGAHLSARSTYLLYCPSLCCAVVLGDSYAILPTSRGFRHSTRRVVLGASMASMQRRIARRIMELLAKSHDAGGGGNLAREHVWAWTTANGRRRMCKSVSGSHGLAGTEHATVLVESFRVRHAGTNKCHRLHRVAESGQSLMLITDSLVRTRRRSIVQLRRTQVVEPPFEHPDAYGTCMAKTSPSPLVGCWWGGLEPETLASVPAMREQASALDAVAFASAVGTEQASKQGHHLRGSGCKYFSC
ncbi:hypothetical protein RJ55_02840 [Drechmeria coniospora]|nr:hypothetical protein RJ55_02840 [Drechmeria coniospora]